MFHNQHNTLNFRKLSCCFGPIPSNMAFYRIHYLWPMYNRLDLYPFRTCVPQDNTNIREFDSLDLLFQTTRFEIPRLIDSLVCVRTMR